jgi:hypothetical protein
VKVRHSPATVSGYEVSMSHCPYGWEGEASRIDSAKSGNLPNQDNSVEPSREGEENKTNSSFPSKLVFYFEPETIQPLNH